MTQKIRLRAADGYDELTLLKPHRAKKVDGYQLLVESIFRLAAKDLKGNNRKQRFDAMDFFRSEWFEKLTCLDGEEIIQQLLA